MQSGLPLHASEIDDAWRSCCAVVIPCLNEAATIGPLVGQIREYLPKVIVVDDGSRDETANVARAAGAEVIRLARSTGKGSALRAGWRRASELGLSWVLNMDGDGQHSPADIPRFLANADRNQPALIIGNRMDDPRHMPWLRRTVNRWMSACLSNAAGIALPDSQCGFRLVHLGSVRKMELRTQHYQIESEMVVAFARLGIPVRFVPVQVIYRRERSNINPLVDTIRWLRWFQGR